jgi:hypothetical protein
MTERDFYQLVFSLSDGKTRQLTLTDAKTGLAAAQLNLAIGRIIASGVFDLDNVVKLEKLKSGRLVHEQRELVYDAQTYMP